MPRPSPRKLPLNDIQRTMLKWNSIHPYNVVDWVEISRPISQDTLAGAADRVFREINLGVPRHDPEERTCDFGPEHAIPTVSSISLGKEITLERFLAREMNTPFVVGRDPAVRLALLADESRQFVAMTYQHWVMDGQAAAKIFHRILGHALDIPFPAGAAEELDTPAIENALAPFFDARQRRIRLREGLGGLLTRTRGFAPHGKSANDSAVSVRILKISPGALLRLKSTARENKCTVNDVLLAIVFRAIDRALPERKRRIWRRHLAVCSIADLRPLSSELQGKLGVYLGFFGTRLSSLPQGSAALLGAIGKQTARCKGERVYLASLATFRTIPRLWNLLNSQRLSVLLRAFFPYTAGLSNLRLTTEAGVAVHSGHLRGYTRACPLGMMLPLIFGATTVGEEFTLTMTSLDGAYRENQVEEMVRSLQSFFAEDFRSSGVAV